MSMMLIDWALKVLTVLVTALSAMMTLRTVLEAAKTGTENAWLEAAVLLALTAIAGVSTVKLWVVVEKDTKISEVTTILNPIEGEKRKNGN